MDPIESFIKSNLKFSLAALTTAHSRLSVLQLQKGFVTQEDTQQSLRSQFLGQQMTPADIGAHAGLLFESIISPSISATGQVKLMVKKEIVGNDENFINAILGVLGAKCGDEYPLVEEFKRESLNYLRQLAGSDPEPEPQPKLITQSPTPALAPALAAEDSIYEPPNVLNPPEFSSSTPKMSFTTSAAPSPVLAPVPVPAAAYPRTPSNTSLPSVPQLNQHAPPAPPHHVHIHNHTHSNHGHPIPPPIEYDGPEEHKYAPARVEFERAEPIVRLLAQVRKVGMDILFPQSTHDKILAIIFVAVRSFATPAHRELIDMVMTVKESNKVSQLEPVSKTKIRGVLALLKHGELLITQGEYGEPVRLSLAPGIESFKDLRERHDIFLSMYMQDHHLFIPHVLRTELVWNLDDETRLMRLDAMDKLVLKLRNFFSGLSEYSAHAIEGAPGVGGASVNSVAVGADAGYKTTYMQPPQAAVQGAQGYARGGKFPAQAGGGRGRGYSAPYGGRGGGRYGYSNNYFGGFDGSAAGGPAAGPAAYGYNGYAAGNGNGNSGGGGRYGGGYQSRAQQAQQQRLANAQASLNWANNEDYAELANEDWSDKGSNGGRGSNGGSSNTSDSGSNSNSISGVTFTSTGTGLNIANINSQLSPQAPSFDPSKLKGNNNNNNNTLKGSAHGLHQSHAHGKHSSHSMHTLSSNNMPNNNTNGTIVHGLSGSNLTSLSPHDILGFDYSRLGGSRLSALTTHGGSLVDPKSTSSPSASSAAVPKIDSTLDDSWLAASAAGGRSNYDFWSDSGSFFDSMVGSGNGTTGNGNGNGASGGLGLGFDSSTVLKGGSELGFNLGELSLNTPSLGTPSTGMSGMSYSAFDHHNHSHSQLLNHNNSMSRHSHSHLDSLGSPVELNLSFDSLHHAIGAVIADESPVGGAGNAGGGLSGLNGLGDAGGLSDGSRVLPVSGGGLNME